MVDDILYNEIIENMDNDLTKLNNHYVIGTEMLLLSLISLEDSMTYLILKELKVTKEDIINKINSYLFIRPYSLYTKTLENVLKRARELEESEEYVYDEAYLYSLLENKDNVAIDILKCFKIEDKDILDELSNALDYLHNDSNMLINLSLLAKEKKLNTFIGRDDYIDRIDRILSKKQKNNCILLGLAGVGKSGLVEGLATFYLKEKPKTTIYQLDLGSLIAGTRYRGDLEEKLMDVLDSIKNKNCILFIDEIHNILNNNQNDASLDIANLLKPYLARSSIKCIGATTTDEYYRSVDKDKALSRRFLKIYVEEPTKEECFNILSGIKKEYEDFHNVKYDNNILKYIVDKSRHNLNNNYPDKAIDVLDEAGLLTNKYKNKKVNKDIVRKVILESINLKINYDYLNLSNLDEKLKSDINKFINLENDNYITYYDITTLNKEKIILDLLTILNLTKEFVLEIDAEDFYNEQKIATLLGTSPGYIGYEDGGILSNHIIKHNVSILILNNLDESNSVFTSLVNKIKTTGLIKDYHGKTLNFLNTIILYTRNNKKRIDFKN